MEATPVPDSSPRPRLVVGVDDSSGARAALRHALRRAALCGGELDVLVCYAPEFYWMGEMPVAVPDLTELRDATEQRAAEIVVEAKDDTTGSEGVPVRVLATAEPAAGELVRHSLDADLVVVGSRGRGAVRSALLGSTSLHVVTHARCPVVVVHEPKSERADRAGAPRVLVGVDGSAPARMGLLAAVEEAVQLGAELEVVACYQPAAHWSDLWQVVVPSIAQIRAELQAAAEAQLASVLADRPEGAPAPPARVEVAEGPPADVLVQRSREADLLVVGSRGHGALRGVLLGSVALYSTMHAECPVLVVHPRTASAHEETVSG